MNNSYFFFDLEDFINDRVDWDSAYFLGTKILSQYPEPISSSFDDVGSKMLLTTSILSIAQTEYPDLLTIRAFLLLPRLRARLLNALQQGKLSEFGIEVINGIVYLLDCPEDRIAQLIKLSERAIDLYLKNFDFPQEAIIPRAKYLDLIFPMPNNASDPIYGSEPNSAQILLSA